MWKKIWRWVGKENEFEQVQGGGCSDGEFRKELQDAVMREHNTGGRTNEGLYHT